MSGANQSLSEFVGFLSNPDMYGSMSNAASMMAWLLSLVVFFLMVCSVIGVAFIVFKFACDIVFLSGLGHMIGDSKAGKIAEKFASENASKGDIMGYLKADIWKLIVTLAFVGILASGMALPIAGQVAGAAGAVISKLVGLDVAGKIEDFNYNDFKKSIELMNPDDKKANYDKYVQEAKTYLNQLYTLSNDANFADNAVEIEQKKTLYVIALNKAEAISGGSTDVYYSAHRAKSVCNSALAGKGSSNKGTGISSSKELAFDCAK